MSSAFTPRLARFLLFTAFALVIAMFASACGLLGDDDDDGGSDGSTSSGRYTVLQAAIGTDINEQQQLTTPPARAFPEATNRVYAVIVLQGVDVGAEVTGRWFQLSTTDVPPAGSLVSEAGVTLTQDNITADGAARVALNLGSDAGALPAGDWVVRVYVNGEFVRTMGFVITPLLSSGASPQPQPTQPAQPEPSPTQGVPGEQTPAAGETPASPAEETPAAPQSYTVQPGDTLTVIAEQFKTPEETTDSYVQRLTELNSLPPGSILFVGQELQLPGPPP